MGWKVFEPGSDGKWLAGGGTWLAADEPQRGSGAAARAVDEQMPVRDADVYPSVSPPEHAFSNTEWASKSLQKYVQL